MTKFTVRCYPYGDDQPIDISMDVEGSDYSGTYDLETYDLNAFDTLIFMEDLSNRAGMFGHLIGKSTTPVDLYHALLKDEVEIVEGEELITTYTYSFPENSQS